MHTGKLNAGKGEDNDNNHSKIFKSQQRQNNKRLNWERIVYCLLTAMPQEAPRGAY